MNVNNTKYEYTTQFFEVGTVKNNLFNEKYRTSILEEINKLGELGWELVSFIPINAGYGWTNQIMLIFKRKV